MEHVSLEEGVLVLLFFWALESNKLQNHALDSASEAGLSVKFVCTGSEVLCSSLGKNA